MNKSKKIFFLLSLFFSLSLILNGFSIEGWNFFISNELNLKYNQLSNAEEQFYEAFSILAGYKKWSANFTLRANNFFKQSPNKTLNDTNYDLFRKSIHYKSKNLRVTFGDFYALLGRGLVLSVLKNDDILRERTILGGKTDLNLKSLGISLMGGIIKDETNLQKWLLSAGEFRYRIFKKNRIGFHFSYIDDIETFRNSGKRVTYSLSFHGTNILKYFSYYTEIAFLDFIENSSDRGKALYSNITYNRGHFTVSAEYKYYKNFNNEMNNPPVADREDEVSSLTDSEGGRILLSYTLFDPDITFFINFGDYSEYGNRGIHFYGGISSQDLWERLSVSASYGIKNILYPIKKFSTDIIYQFSDSFSFEISSKDKRYRDKDFIFIEKDHSLQLSLYPLLSITFLYQYSHNAIININDFFSSSVTLYLKNNLEITLTGGNIRGGQVCSGGQCFIMPPFKGVKLSVLKIFR